MRTSSRGEEVLILALLLLLSCCWATNAQAQQLKAPPRVFSGPLDTGVRYPTKEGSPGQKDATALALLKQAITPCMIPAQSALDISGSLTSGPGTASQQYPLSLAIENGKHFRLDLRRENGIHISKINGNGGKTQHGDKAPQEIEDTEFSNPLAMPYLLWEIANRQDAAVTDDGSVELDGQVMRRITITLQDTRFGGTESASFYLGNTTHLLEKGVFVEHSEGNRSLASLKVATYKDYRVEQSLLVPHQISETVNGRLYVSVEISSAALTPIHDETDFAF